MVLEHASRLAHPRTKLKRQLILPNYAERLAAIAQQLYDAHQSATHDSTIDGRSKSAELIVRANETKGIAKNSTAAMRSAEGGNSVSRPDFFPRTIRSDTEKMARAAKRPIPNIRFARSGLRPLNSITIKSTAAAATNSDTSIIPNPNGTITQRGRSESGFMHSPQNR
jgi:hypothetical protein